MKQRRKELGLSAEAIAEALGISPATIYRYENGAIDKVPGDRLAPIAKVLKTSPAYLMGWEENSSKDIPEGFEPMPEMSAIPRIGQIACGTPILAQQNIECMDSAPKSWNATFSLVCKGDSMMPSIQDGDLVAIRQQPMVENGEIAVVQIGDEATLKRVYLKKSQIILQPENPEYEPIVLFGEEINDVKIIGKAVGLCRGL